MASVTINVTKTEKSIIENLIWVLGLPDNKEFQMAASPDQIWITNLTDDKELILSIKASS